MANKKSKKNRAPQSAAKSKLSPGFIVVVVTAITAAAVAGVVAGVLVNRGGGSDGPKPPDFAYGPTTPKGTVKAYQFAIDHPELLAYIPCYCGCGQEAGHTSNLDCFIKKRNGNEITFDDHAAY